MAKYDPKLVDEYIVHLGQMSRQRQCVASRDIRNEFGVLLIPKGTVISPHVAARINQHTLDVSLDDAVALENSLTSKQLFIEFQALFSRFPNLMLVHSKNNFEQALDFLCRQQQGFQVLLQKLTVLQERFPDCFGETLFCAWFSALLAQKQGEPVASVGAIFTAGLYGKLGLLHIPAAAVLDPPQHRQQFQTHVVISCLIARSTGLHSDALLQAILEHHEKLLGEGYPHGKDSESISALGMLSAMSTRLYQLLGILPRSQAGNLAIALPYLRVHYALQPNKTVSTALMCIKAAGLAPVWENLAMDTTQYTGFLLDKALLSCQLSAAIHTLYRVLLKQTLSPQGNTLVSRLQRAVALLHATGISNLDTIAILSGQDAVTAIGFDDMVEFDFIQADFFYLARQALVQLRGVLGAEDLAADVRDLCDQQLALMDSILQGEVDATWFHRLKRTALDEAASQA